MDIDPAPFEAMERAFQRLADPLAPLVVDSGWLGDDPPGRPVTLPELRSWLLHPSVDYEARDGVLGRLAALAAGDERWMVGVVGMLLPGLRRAVHPLVASHRELASDAESEALAALVEAVRALPAGASQVASRLIHAAGHAAARFVAAEIAIQARSEPAAEARLVVSPSGHPDLVLADAVAAGVISTAEAELIGATRLSGIPLEVYAAARHEPYGRAQRRRWRAEERLVAWITENLVSENGP